MRHYLSVLFFFFVQTASPLHWDGNILYDLEATTVADMTTEAAAWTLSSYVTPGAKSYKCGTYVLLGGYNILGGNGISGSNAYYGQYFSRTYDSLPIHNQIYIQILFYAIDSWDGGTDHFNIGIDNNSIFGWTLSKQPAYSSKVCGKSVDPEIPPFTAFVSYAHSATSLTLKIINYADEASDNESLGFRDIKIEFLTSSNPYSSLCSASSAPLETTTTCGSSCAGSDLSMNPPGSGICSPTSCSSSCNTCSGSSTTCATCKTGEYMIGNSCFPDCNDPYLPAVLGGVTYCTTPCPGKFIWWDKSCNTACSYSTGFSTFEMKQSTLYTFSQCDFPCGANQYLYWNGSCVETCPEPLTKLTYKGKNLCEFHCDSSKYLYRNGSCEAACEFPLVSEVQNGRKFCWYPCAVDQYLYWNGSCVDKCPEPMSAEIQVDRKFCWYGCQPAEFLYWNGSCESSCESPLSSEIQGTIEPRNFCWYPCQSNEYLYWNGSCIDKCDLPLSTELQGDRKFCWYGCQPAEYLYWNGSCESSCESPLSSEIQGTVESRNFCWYSCQPNEYLYWNGSCIETCPEPLSMELQGDKKFCWYGCQPDEHLYWNGSCESGCGSPLSSEIQGTVEPRNFCWYPCQDNEFIYWNGSCLSSCPEPLSTEIQGGRNFCWYGCQPAEYLYWNGSCENTCPSPLSQEIQGTVETRNFCWYPCQDNEFLHWNGSCLNSCPAPLNFEIQHTRKFCWYPCQPGEYLYWNGSCLDSCEKPLALEVQDTRNFCWYPCQQNEFLYWNGSCLPQCEYPLIEKLEENYQFCINPCEGKFLYSNQSCSSKCPNPLTVINNPGVQYCTNTCTTPGDFLYDNKTCLSTCVTPFVKKQDPGVLYCQAPCSTPPNIYWYANKSCEANCPSPYVKTYFSGILQCLSPCKKETDFYYEYEKQCRATCQSPYQIKTVGDVKVCSLGTSISLPETEKVQDISDLIDKQGKFTGNGLKATSALNSGSPSSALLAGLSSMFQYIRYMKINYPPKVQVLFLVSASNPISFGFGIDMPGYVEEGLKDNELPEVFERYDINSNFVSNLWDFLSSLLLMVLVIFCLAILKRFFRSCKRIEKVLEKILQVFKWNIPIMMICGSSGDIFFFTSLQIQSSHFTELSSIISLSIGALLTALVLVILAITVKIVWEFRRQRQVPKDNWKDYEILYEEYEEKTILSLGYMAVFIVRGIVFNLTLANLYNYPLVQSIIINVFNLLMFGYLLYLKPLKSFLALVQLFINEGLLNVLGICVLILAIMDKAHINGQATRESVGTALIFVIQAFNTFGLIFLGLGLLVFIVSIFKIWRRLKAQNIKSPFEMLKMTILEKLELEYGSKEAVNESANGNETTLESIEASRKRARKMKIRRPERKEKGKDIDTSACHIIYLEENTNNNLNNISHLEDNIRTSSHFLNIVPDIMLNMSLSSAITSFPKSTKSTLQVETGEMRLSTVDMQITDLSMTQQQVSEIDKGENLNESVVVENEREQGKVTNSLEDPNNNSKLKVVHSYRGGKRIQKYIYENK